MSKKNNPLPHTLAIRKRLIDDDTRSPHYAMVVIAFYRKGNGHLDATETICFEGYSAPMDVFLATGELHRPETQKRRAHTVHIDMTSRKEIEYVHNRFRAQLKAGEFEAKTTAATQAA